VDIDIFLPAGVDQCLHHVAGVPVPPVFVQREDAVHLKACRVAGAAGGRSEVSIDEYAEYAFVLQICFLAPVLGPDFLGQGEFLLGELAGGGFGHWGVAPCGDFWKGWWKKVRVVMNEREKIMN